MRSVTKHDKDGRMTSHTEYKGKNIAHQIKYHYIGDEVVVSYLKYYRLYAQEYRRNGKMYKRLLITTTDFKTVEYYDSHGILYYNVEYDPHGNMLSTTDVCKDLTIHYDNGKGTCVVQHGSHVCLTEEGYVR